MSVQLRVLLPNFKPWPLDRSRTTRGADKTTRRSLSGRVIGVTIIEEGLHGRHGRERRIKYGEWERIFISDADGLLTFRKPHTKGMPPLYLSDSADHLTPDGDAMTFQCRKLPPRSRMSYRHYLHCRTQYRIAAGVELSYSFDAANLIHWRELDAGVRSLVESFAD